MTVKELTQEARHEEALKKYVLDAPQLLEEIKDLSADDQKDQIQWAFEDEAEAQGLQPWELTPKYTSTRDRKSVGAGSSVAVGVGLGRRSLIYNENTKVKHN